MSFYDIDLVTIDGKPQRMDVYRGFRAALNVGGFDDA
jgi:hypothetical protein